MTTMAVACMAERAHPLPALAAASPLGDAVQLTALPPTARLIIRGDVGCIGVALPAPCRAATGDAYTLLWLGPDEFMCVSRDEIMPEIALQPPASAIDVSHRDVALSVAGPRAAWVINAFCALDLYPSAFPVGMCTRTVFAKAEIMLWRTASETFRIDVARSLAAYVWGCLEEARREFLA
jgi:heterotetrameric sarcosine oxidase gamma subunit